MYYNCGWHTLRYQCAVDSDNQSAQICLKMRWMPKNGGRKSLLLHIMGHCP